MSSRSLGLIKHARLTRRQLVAFALVSACLNGLITASVGAWLGQTYAKYQARRQSIESLVHLVYERRTRAGMVASALKRGADIDEVRYRKRAYDESYVDWNKNAMQNIFAIREVTGETMFSGLEKYYEDGLIAAMADVDRCLTKAYDVRLANSDPKPELERCKMPELHQFVLDCGATFTNELYKLTRLSFLPFGAKVGNEGRDTSEKRIKAACVSAPLKDEPKPAAPPASGTPAAPPVADAAAKPSEAKTPAAPAAATPEPGTPPPASGPGY